MIRLAQITDLERVLEIVQDARALFRSKGSTQWQDSDGYPNKETFINDINKNQLYVYDDGQVRGICVVSFDVDHNYDVIDGKWLSLAPYAVIHRIATDKDSYNMGIGSLFFRFAEDVAKRNNVYDIKADTGLDNDIMIHLFEKFGYQNCGIITLLRDTVIDKKRIGFEKILS